MDSAKQKLFPAGKPNQISAEISDTDRYPHYDVQRAVYRMLLSALSLSDRFEKLPGYEERQKKLGSLASEYFETCESLKIHV